MATSIPVEGGLPKPVYLAGGQLDGAQQTQEKTPSVLYDGTQAGAAGAAALNGGTSLPCTYVLVQNSPSSAGNLLIGNSSTQSIVLTPGGAAESIPIDNVNKVYIKLASGSAATANWHAV